MKYPNCTVSLAGVDGNAFAVMGAVTAELKRHLRDKGMEPPEIRKEIEAFRNEAMSGDYQNLLNVCTEWVDVTL